MSSLLFCSAVRAGEKLHQKIGVAFCSLLCRPCGEKLSYKKRAGVTEAAVHARGKSLLEKVAEDSENLPSVRGGRFLPAHQGVFVVPRGRREKR